MADWTMNKMCLKPRLIGKYIRYMVTIPKLASERFKSVLGLGVGILHITLLLIKSWRVINYFENELTN